ncbi:MAG: HYR domain-containing protein, partial [Acidobacteriota bacterium]
EVFRNDPNRPERLSDHDMPIAYFTLPCEIACPSDITVPNDTAQCGAIVNFSTPSTNCMGVTCTPASGAFFPVGTTTVNCSESAPPITGAEAEVNLAVAPGSSCSFTVTVNDMQTPAVNCPSNISVSASMDQCSAVVNFMATGMDNCSVASVTCNPPSGATFPVGITTVTCKATDTAGNMSPTCSFTVTVNDTEPPQISCAPLTVITVTPTPGGSCATVNYALPAATDNCAGVTVACSPPPGSCFPVGTTTINCTATDASGNTASTAVSCPSGGSGISVTVFDICLQDDSSASRVLLFNSQTGDYIFCCGGVQFSGKGTVTRKGNTITLNHSGGTPSRRVSASVTIGGANKGDATLQSPPGTTVCTIRDSNILNNSCACGGTT